MKRQQIESVDRDRRMQVFLAQARGVVRNGDLFRQSVDRALQILTNRNGVNGVTMNDELVNTLEAVTTAMESLGISYAATGSVASSIHGEPHSTIDADLILVASAEHAKELSLRLSPRFYAPDDMLMQASRDGTMANVVDNRNGLKIDLSFVAGDVYLHRVMSRREKQRIGSSTQSFWLVTAEDVILMKLLWRVESQSSKQWNDALGVVQVRGNKLDWRYLRETAGQLGLTDDLIRLRDEGGV